VLIFVEAFVTVNANLSLLKIYTYMFDESPRTCNPYFVKSLNLGTSTLTGDGEIKEAGMLVDTGAREISHSKDFSELEDFIEDEEVVSKLRESRINTMENLTQFYRRHEQWFMNQEYWTVYEFRVIKDAVDKFDG